VLFQNKISLRYCASGWVYYRNSVLSFASDSHIILYNCKPIQLKPRYQIYVAAVWYRSMCVQVSRNVATEFGLRH